MAVDVVVLGLKDLGDTMKLLEQAVEKRIIRRAMRRGTKVVVDEVKNRAPRDSGELANAITSKEVITRDGGILESVGVKYGKKVASKSRKPGRAPSSEDPAVYAKFIEFGRPGKGGHTHQAAHPFIRPAFDSKKDEAQQVIGNEIMAGIESEFKK